MRTEKDWFPNDKATHEWLDSQKKSTRATYQTNWKYFLEYTGMTGDQILADRKQDAEHRWERKVLAFKQWMMDEKKQSEYTATAAAATVRGFFAFHYTQLKYRRGEGRKLKERKRKTEDYRFSRDDLKKMFDVADLTEKYVIVAGKSFGLRASDFIKLTRGNVEPYLDREVPISLGEIPTKKEGVSAFPFIDSDALPVIRLMIQQMDREGRKQPSDRILPWKSQIELTNALQRTAKRAGLNTGNKIVRFHCLRKFLIDRLSSFMSESKWKLVVGKSVDEKAYVSPDSLREDYQRAMSETCFTKAVAEGDMELRITKRLLEAQLKQAGYSSEQLKKIFREKAKFLGRELNAKDEVEALEELTKKPKTATDGGCRDGHCQRLASEDELPKLLAEGWHASLVLPSGKVVLER